MSVEIKREIIGALLQRRVLVSKEMLLKLNQIDDISSFKRDFGSFLSSAQVTADSFLELLASFSPRSRPPPVPEVPGVFDGVEPGSVEVSFSYEQEPKKREVKDFVDFFTARYNALRAMLQNRSELRNLTSINRLRGKFDRDDVSVIGLISDKQVTKNGKLLLFIEDPTGTVKVSVSPEKDVYAVAKDCMLDEVVGVCGAAGDGIIFANNLLLPDVPAYKELRKSPDEAYAVFIGDLHFGSGVFLSDSFEKFLSWISGEDERYIDVVKRIKYLFLVGDLVEGVGIYPGQEDDLSVKDIYEQYRAMARAFTRIPQHIKIIICPGNHDAMRIAEPQPPLYKDFAEPVWKLPNVVMVSNPALVNIHRQEGFPGLDVLLYHGFSFPYYADAVESIRSAGGQERVDMILEFLLRRRHLAPEHKSTLYLPDQKKDSLVIDRVPDIFASGHIHRVSATAYRNVTLLNCSCWLKTTEYQEKLGLKPQPGRAVLVNLQTRKVKLLKFYDEEKAKADSPQSAPQDIAVPAAGGA